MSQLGAGLVGTGDPSYPGVIDTYQTFRNGTPLAPDSDTRIDAELLMDILRAIIAIETTLGTNPQGAYGSVAARLAALDTGVVTPSNIVSFINQQVIAVSGASHALGSRAILAQTYETGTPALAMQPQSLTVDPTTFDVVLSFAGPQSGTLILGVPSPTYIATYTNATSVTVLGTTHGLGVMPLLYQAYDAATPAAQIQVGSLAVHSITFDVTLTFAVAQSGILVLAAGTGWRYAQAFSNATLVTVFGTSHALGTAALLWQIYDNQQPAQAIQPQSVSVHPSTFDVTVTFAVPQSGTILVIAAVEP